MSIETKYQELVDSNLNLMLTRGKPGSDQLELSRDMLRIISNDDLLGKTDYRNYGLLNGTPEAIKFFSQYLNVEENECFVGGSSSLQLMHTMMTFCLLKGTTDGMWPENPKFICLVPGYDRHFTICQTYDIEMIPVELTEDGPDMDHLREVASDPSVVGMWIVPKYSNPSGFSISQEVAEDIVTIEYACPQFRIFCDDAYRYHFIEADKDVPVVDFLNIAKNNDVPNRVFCFGSTSKITFPGAGVAVMGMSEDNMNMYKKLMGVSIIGFDKINMTRHIQFFDGKIENLVEHMKLHAKIMKDKRDAVLQVFDDLLSEVPGIEYTRPLGGYFIYLQIPNKATRVYELAKEAGVALTPVGATHPYKNDPNDAVLRIAFSYPSVEDVFKAAEVVAVCILLAYSE
ncbi:hypothetical protein PCE1_000177 [Barthelona sp. PCE]